NRPEYESNHIYHLRKTSDVYEGDGTRASHTEYSYDDFPLTPNPGGTPGHYSAQSTPFRGNLTKVTSYANAVDAADPSTESRYYDVTGNLIKISSACCEQTSIEYQLDTWFAYPTKATRGAIAEDPSARITTQASYDYSTGLRRSSTDANGL